MIKYIVAVIAALAILAGAYVFGHHVAAVAGQLSITTLKDGYDKQLADANKARADAEQAARDTEAKRVADMASLDANYQKELSDAKTVSDAAVAAVRAGTVRVRDRFTCNAGSGSVPSAAKAGASTGSTDAASANGLQPEDAEFLLREAARADAVTVQLRALQDVVRRDRQ